MSRRPAAGIALAVLSLLAVAAPSFAAISTSEREALIAIYNKTGGPNWTNRSGWLGAPGTECSWFGVLCNQSPNFVAILNLPANNLTGPVPAEIAQLTLLEQLYLQDNALTGPIPKELGSTLLRNITLSRNKLTGPIPPELGNAASLRTLALDSNDLTGGIPAALSQLPLLINLVVHSNPNLGGTLPPEHGNHKRLQALVAYDSGINGSIPPEYGGMSALTSLRIGGNNLTGTIPPELAAIPGLQLLVLRENELEGPIPAWLGNMKSLTTLNLGANRFTGEIPPELGNLSNLTSLLLFDLDLTGTFPAELGNLSRLSDIRIYNTGIGGPIPAFLGALPDLTYVELDGNRLTGEIPSSLGSRTLLVHFSVSNNVLTGEIPASFANLVNLENGGGLDLAYNGLTSSDPALTQFLESKHSATEAPFTSLQTVAPTGVSATAASPTSIRVDWTPIAYKENAGGYQVEIAGGSVGGFRLAATTADKSASSLLVSGLAPGTAYQLRVSTVTYGGSVQKNTIVSASTPAVSATTQPAGPSVVLTSAPDAILVAADGTSTASATYVVTNVGQAPTTITLTQNGTFFTQSPTTFTLGPGSAQRVTITSLPQAAVASLRGSSTPSGAGVPSSLVVPVSLLAATPPSGGAPKVVVASTRVDVSAPRGTNPTGSVTFVNIGTATATGILSADVPWIVPDPELITIAAGQQVGASFRVERARRPDGAAPSGTLTANLSFVYLAPGGVTGRGLFGGLPSLSTPVAIGDTVTPPVTVSGIPLLGPDEIGLVIPGLAKIGAGASATTSDISIVNAGTGLAVSDLELYYLLGASSQSAAQPVDASQSLSLSDVVGTVFGESGSGGALHVRSTLAPQLGVGAWVRNGADPAGSFGALVPVFRTNRGLAKGETSMIGGIAMTAETRTDLVLQETAGAVAIVDVTFLGAAGQSLGVAAGLSVSPWQTRLVESSSLPDGTAAVLLANKGDGAIVAYATGRDGASGDSWSVADWNRYFGRSGSEEQVVPVAGSVDGRNGTRFRTDLAISNPGTAQAEGTLRYYQQRPVARLYEKPVTVGARATLELPEVTTSFFGAGAQSMGHLVLAPSSASLAMTSRTYTKAAGSSKSYGTGVPALSRGAALRLGQSRVIGGLRDATWATASDARAGSFRTNLGVVETEGESVTVRVSILFFDGRALAAGGAVAAKSYVLGPHESRLLAPVVGEVLGAASRENDFGELDNVQVKVEVTAGTGGVLVFASSTDNASGDTVVRIE